MSDRSSPPAASDRGRRGRLIATTAALLAVVAGLAWGWGATQPQAPAATSAPAVSGPAPSPLVTEGAAAVGAAPADAVPAPASAGRAVAAGDVPASVLIPAIGVSTPALVPLGIAADGTMQAPADFDRAGWFTGGVAPGERGPAVIAGHVDSRTGPAVFYRLRELLAGDAVEVRQRDGDVVRFAVSKVERYAKDAFPTAKVYGPVPGPVLRLITCGGVFDRATGHYRDNVVVYANPV